MKARFVVPAALFALCSSAYANIQQYNFTGYFDGGAPASMQFQVDDTVPATTWVYGDSVRYVDSIIGGFLSFGGQTLPIATSKPNYVQVEHGLQDPNVWGPNYYDDGIGFSAALDSPIARDFYVYLYNGGNAVFSSTALPTSLNLRDFEGAANWYVNCDTCGFGAGLSSVTVTDPPAVAATSVPEPGTLALAMLALGFVAWRRHGPH